MLMCYILVLFEAPSCTVSALLVIRTTDEKVFKLPKDLL